MLIILKNQINQLNIAILEKIPILRNVLQNVLFLFTNLSQGSCLRLFILTENLNHTFLNDDWERTENNILVLLPRMTINTLFCVPTDIQLPKFRFKLGLYLSKKLFVLFTLNFVRLCFGSLH